MIIFYTPLFLTILFAMPVLTWFLIKLWNDPLMKDFHDVYNSVQKIHDGYTPRLGGLVFYVFFLSIVLFFDFEGFDLLRIIGFALLPTVFITVVEDIFNNVKPKARLFSIFISSFLLFTCVDFTLPVINIPFIKDFFIEHPLFLVILLTISLSALANGFNLIDGSNGLLYFSFLSILIAMLILANAFHSILFVNIYSLLLTLTIMTMVFNYPFGKMFAGDLGAYCLGLLVGFVTILFFGEYPSMITWYALLILFYPSFELIFSMLRRYRNKKPIMGADNMHMHQLIFLLLSKKYSTKVSNNLIVLILSPVWLFPLIWICIHGPFMSFFMTWLGILLECCVYLSMYRYFLIKINVSS